MPSASPRKPSGPLRRVLAKGLAQLKPPGVAGSGQPGSHAAESRERYRRATLGAVAGVVARAASLLTVFVSVPVALAELGSQQFGIWATLTSFAVLLNFADLGISNGLVNLLVRADAEADQRNAAEHVTSALVLLILLAAFLGIVFALAYVVVDWAAFYNAGPSLADASAHATAVFVGCFLALLPLGLFQRIHLGYQEALMTYTWTAVGSILGLAGVLACGFLDASLAWFVAATAGGPVIAAVLNGVVLMGRSRPELRPRPDRVKRDSLRNLATTGGAFFLIQGSVAVALNSGPIVVAQVEGAASVEDLAVPMRLFAFLPVLLSIAMTAVWPALRAAVLKGDIEWVRKALKRTTWLGLFVVALPTLGLVIFGDTVVRLWTSGDVGASTSVRLAFGAWGMLSAAFWPLFTVLIATNALKEQTAMSVLTAVTGVVLSVWLTSRMGIVGVVLGTAVAQLVFFVLPATVYMPKLLRRLERAKIPSI